jgi:hypothetical protein
MSTKIVKNTITTIRKGRFQLAKIIGAQFRFDLDEAWFHELADIREPNRLWYERIPCQKDSFIGVHSVKPLIFKLYSTRPQNAKKIHQAIKGKPGFIKADFCFDGEAELYFTKEALSTVAELAGARKKRQLTLEQKAVLAKGGSAHQFKGQKDGVEREKTTPIEAPFLRCG